MLRWVIERTRGWYWRGKRRMVDGLAPRVGVRRARIFGAEFELNLGEFIQRSIYLGTFETLEARCFASLLRSGMTVVDAGANVGFYTALACERMGAAGQVIAYEPSAYAFERLQQLRLPAERIAAALGAAAGEATLYVEPDNNYSPSLVSPRPEGARQERVAVRTLDGEAARLGLERIDVLKADVEGWESALLRGAAQLLRERRIGAILMEFHEPYLRLAGSSVAELEGQLVAAGFRDVTPRQMKRRTMNRVYQA